MSEKRIAPPPEDVPCWRCKGTGRITYVRETLDGPEELTDDCRGCGGTGMMKGAPEIKAMNVEIRADFSAFHRALERFRQRALDLSMRWFYADEVCEPEEDVFV